MEAFRGIYRNILVEFILLICVIFQAISGIYFVWLNRKKHWGGFKKVQIISGLYLAYFLLNHISAVLFGRIVLGLDTNIYYGIAGLHISPFKFYFAPYYFLAVAALFIHIASAFNWLSRHKLSATLRAKLFYSIIALGITISVILMMGFCGIFSEIIIPAEYSKIYTFF